MIPEEASSDQEEKAVVDGLKGLGGEVVQRQERGEDFERMMSRRKSTVGRGCCELKDVGHQWRGADV